MTYLWSIHTTRTCASRSCPSGRGMDSYVFSDDPVPDMRSCNGYSEPRFTCRANGYSVLSHDVGSLVHHIILYDTRM